MLKIGDKVLCRYFNTPERKFYGDYFKGEVMEKIVQIGKVNWKIKKEDGFFTTSHRKEIKKILK